VLKLQKGDVITYESGKIVIRNKTKTVNWNDIFDIGVNIDKLKQLSEMMGFAAGYNIKFCEKDRAFIVI